MDGPTPQQAEAFNNLLKRLVDNGICCTLDTANRYLGLRNRGWAYTGDPAWYVMESGAPTEHYIHLTNARGEPTCFWNRHAVLREQFLFDRNSGDITYAESAESLLEMFDLKEEGRTP